MMSDPIHKQTADFVERFGEYWASTGSQRIAGRIMGWLLVCDPPHQSAGEIVEVTKASKASVSIALRILLERGLIERIGVAGERSAFYRIRSATFTVEFLIETQKKMTEMRQILEGGLSIFAEEPKERRRRLEFALDFYSFVESQLPELIDRWLARSGDSISQREADSLRIAKLGQR